MNDLSSGPPKPEVSADAVHAEAMAEQPVHCGPTDIQDPQLRHEARKAAVWIGMATLAGLVVFFAQPLLVIFGGIVFAAMIDGGARLLGRVLPVRRGQRILIVLVAAFGFLAWALSFAGTQLALQAAEMPEVVRLQMARLIAWAQAHGINVRDTDLNALAQQAITGVGPLTHALGGLLGALSTLFLIAVIGIYIALEPRLYQRGVAWMLPETSADEWAETAQRMGHALRRLLAGRLLGMAVEGFATWVLLALWGVPLAGLLGLLTGMLAFLPNIGAPVSGALMVLVGFSGGTDMGLYCIAVYVLVQTVDGNVIVPMVARKTVDLAPALVLGAQLVFGVMFGVLGLALADPLIAMLKILLERRSERNSAAAASRP